MKQIFSSGRDYGGYSDPGRGNPEPYAYYTNWAFRRLIEQQISGNSDLSYSGSNPQIPWLAWSGYIWADGKNKRNDGFNWICPDDLQDDGVHPSDKGKAKVVDILFDFFTNDETTSWFRKQNSSNVQQFEIQSNLIISTNPASEYIEINLGSIGACSDENYIWASPNASSLKIYNTFGELVLSDVQHLGDVGHLKRIDISHLPNGIYFIQIGYYSEKFMVVR